MEWSRRGFKGLHSHSGASKRVCGRGSRPYSAGFESYGGIGVQGTDMVRRGDSGIVTVAYSPLPMGVLGQKAACQEGSTPTTSTPSIAPKPDLGRQNDHYGCVEEKSKGRSKRGECIARQDLVVLELRHTRRATAKRGRGFSLSDSPT